MPAPALPSARPLAVAALSRVFANTTTSYKYLLFLAILDAIEREPDANAIELNRRDQAAGMLSVAWFPYSVFRLRFGAQDMVPRYLYDLEIDPVEEQPTVKSARAARERIADEVSVAAAKLLTRYVTMALVRSFARESLALYDVIDDKKTIRINGAWLNYLREHLGIVRGWALWHWLQYMQRRNENTPNVAAKLVPAAARAGLTGQRKLWETALDNWSRSAPPTCVYTGELLDSDWDLDHFVPWAFVAHDQLWNLVPSPPSTNRSKGSKLPRKNLIEPLALMQSGALVAARSSYSTKKWQNLTEDFVTAMELPTELLWAPVIDSTQLRNAAVNAYKRKLPPLLALAEAQGFARMTARAS